MRAIPVGKDRVNSNRHETFGVEGLSRVRVYRGKSSKSQRQIVFFFFFDIRRPETNKVLYRRSKPLFHKYISRVGLLPFSPHPLHPSFSLDLSFPHLLLTAFYSSSCRVTPSLLSLLLHPVSVASSTHFLAALHSTPQPTPPLPPPIPLISLIPHLPLSFYLPTSLLPPLLPLQKILAHFANPRIHHSEPTGNTAAKHDCVRVLFAVLAKAPSPPCPLPRWRALK